MVQCRILIIVAVATLVAGCATLSPEAARITTTRDGGVMAMMDCMQLGFVSGDAGIWGGSSGLDSALTDAKNKAAKFHAANAILITSSRMNPTSFVNATVFNCSKRKTQKIELTNPPKTAIRAEKASPTMRRSKRRGFARNGVVRGLMVGA